jgi:hypothetical protein
MKNLIVGKNSIIVKKLLKNYNDLESIFDIVSHTELNSISNKYNKCYIFSYSLHKKDNEVIIDWCCVNCKKVFYISSSSVVVAMHGELYKYPKIKMNAEDYGVQNYKNFFIRRLGYVVDNEMKSNYIRYITDLTDIKHILISNDNAIVINNFKINPNLYDKSLRLKIIMWYSLIQYYIMPFSIILRPIDLIFKILKLQNYGYTSLGDRLWTYMKK